MTDVLALYRRLSRIPGGKHVFSRMLRYRVPYFSSIRPFISALDEGYCKVEMADRRSVHNHLGTIHAIAMCNLCELTMGLGVESVMPRHLRWIAKGMEVHYLKKAHGRLTGEVRVDSKMLKPGDVRVPVSVRDTSGDEVTRAAIIINISPRPAE